MDRRLFVKNAALLYSASRIGASSGLAWTQESNSNADSTALDEVTAKRIPRWRGFNLQGKFSTAEHPYAGPESCLPRREGASQRVGASSKTGSGGPN
jgi:hypothetical protein